MGQERKSDSPPRTQRIQKPEEYKKCGSRIKNVCPNPPGKWKINFKEFFCIKFLKIHCALCIEK
jgi:hypothetical protein